MSHRGHSRADFIDKDQQSALISRNFARSGSLGVVATFEGGREVASDSFQVAAERAASISRGDWEKLSAAERCTAIYDELRKLDREALLAAGHNPATAKWFQIGAGRDADQKSTRRGRYNR